MIKIIRLGLVAAGTSLIMGASALSAQAAPPAEPNGCTGYYTVEYKQAQGCWSHWLSHRRVRRQQQGRFQGRSGSFGGRSWRDDQGLPCHLLRRLLGAAELIR